MNLPIVDNNKCDSPSDTRLLQLSAIPTATEIANIELDLTLDCNLRCRYCYKGDPPKVYMSHRVAFDAVIWLIYASGSQRNLGMFFLGGEPMLNFTLVKELVPFATRRAKQHGKNITFGMTTNGTLVTDETIEFFKKWRVTFHTSIDGCPAVLEKKHFCFNMPKKTYERLGSSGQPTFNLSEKNGACQQAYAMLRKYRNGV